MLHIPDVVEQVMDLAQRLADEEAPTTRLPEDPFVVSLDDVVAA